jgi:hypothetical protein
VVARTATMNLFAVPKMADAVTTLSTVPEVKI